MPISNHIHSRLTAILLYGLILCTLVVPAYAVSAETLDETLGLYSDWQEQPVSAGHAPKPLSQTAENVTVITAADIAALNAHSLADILVTVSGIQVDTHGGPGSISYTNVLSSQTNHVQILLDGVTINNISDNFSDIGMVPAQIIERIEIVKGAASSAWGQALGGVINVITKSPSQRTVSGEASGSLGMRGTDDARGELSGTAGKLGYYFAGGYLSSSGLIPNNQVYSSNGYAKLTLALPGRGEAWGTFGYSGATRGEFAYPPIDAKGNDTVRYLTGTLGFRKPLLEGVEFELLAYHTTRNFDISLSQLSDGLTLQKIDTKERLSGGKANLSWRTTSNLLVVGSEYEHSSFDTNDSFQGFDILNRTLNRWGIYANDTITFGPVAVSGGIRLDHTASSGNQTSPSLGATWKVNDSTVLRAYAGKGYSLPSINLDRPSEKVWNLQTGFETSAIPYFWLKGTLFRNEFWDITVRDPVTSARLSERRIALGAEAELRTVPVFNTSLSTGYTFTDTTRTSDGSQVLAAPRNTVQLGVHYDDKHLLRGALLGRHIWWNADPAFGGRYNGLIWDLFLGAKVYNKEDLSLELFFSGHNLFNGAQFQDEAFRNPGRWYEGGLKVRF